MHKVIIKKRKLEKEFNNVKLQYTVFDVCEISKNEDGSTEINVSQIYNVTDIWNFEDVNGLLEDKE